MLQISHAAGSSELLRQGLIDAVLQMGLLRVQGALRDCDRSEARNAEQVAVLLADGTSSEQVAHIASRLVEVVQREYVVQGHIIYLKAHVGVAMTMETPVPLGTLEERARVALDYAKRAEPGTIVFFQGEMEQRQRARAHLTAELRKALSLDQLEVHYQPQVDLPNCRVVGFEALLRWRHPELGWVSPAEFIPLAEEIGIMGTIGSWVLRTACQRAATLPKQVTMAVNVSPLQLKNGSLLAAVGEALSISRLAPRRLEVEITEGVLLENSGMIRETLDTLHQLGVRLAIDDFGTGYSSLGQLANFPFDTIKIDRSLVGTGVKNRAIVRAIAMLGSGLGMTTLIEGIENKEALLNACCDGFNSAQGFLFGKAVPPSALEEVLARLNQQSGNESSPVGTPTPASLLARDLAGIDGLAN
jgi:EAL domain-containing protein (putative c-di-GMP-specific phosphodiesterase class I)